MKAKEFFGTLASTIAYPFIQFRKKSPLISFISGRIVTMAVLLFLLGFLSAIIGFLFGEIEVLQKIIIVFFR